MQKIVFFFPWREVSGGPFYLTRLANDLASVSAYEIYYTEYPHGLTTSMITQKNIKFLEYHDEERNFSIFESEPVILVMPIYWAYFLPRVHKDTKIVYFNWHNECIPSLKTCWAVDDSVINAFLRLVQKTSSVFFCDKTHWLAQNTESIVFKEQYVPIIIPQRQRIVKSKLINKAERNIAVLGRLCRDKIYAVLDLLDNIVDLGDKIKTNVYIIGDGDCKYLLLQKKFPEHINIVFCGTMDIDDVITLLSKKADILFAMGTSVLEGASIRLPSVVIPNDIKPFVCNRYPYIFESKGYALGWYPSQIDEMDITCHTIQEIFDDIYKFGKKDEFGLKSYEYYIDNHSSNVDKFLEAIENSHLTAGQYREFIHKDKYYLRCFVKKKICECFGRTQRKFSIFGFPLYIKTRTCDVHINIYICCIPLLRINNDGVRISVHILPIVWLYKAFKYFVKCLFYINQNKKENF